MQEEKWKEGPEVAAAIDRMIEEAEIKEALDILRKCEAAIKAGKSLTEFRDDLLAYIEGREKK